jgi:hypothetical protein
LSSPGLASRIEIHPEMDHFNDPSGDFTHDVSIPNILNPPGFKDNPNWDSDMFIWATLKD